jgi:hypothetical protein
MVYLSIYHLGVASTPVIGCLPLSPAFPGTQDGYKMTARKNGSEKDRCKMKTAFSGPNEESLL